MSAQQHAQRLRDHRAECELTWHRRRMEAGAKDWGEKVLKLGNGMG